MIMINVIISILVFAVDSSYMFCTQRVGILTESLQNNRNDLLLSEKTMNEMEEVYNIRILMYTN